VEQTKREIEERKLAQSLVASNLEKYKRLEEETNGIFKISSMTQKFESPLIVGDGESCIWNILEPRKTLGLGVACRHRNVADALIEYVESHYLDYGKDFDQLRTELDI
jgi:hypothetical protein